MVAPEEDKENGGDEGGFKENIKEKKVVEGECDC